MAILKVFFHVVKAYTLNPKIPPLVVHGHFEGVLHVVTILCQLKLILLPGVLAVDGNEVLDEDLEAEEQVLEDDYAPYPLQHCHVREVEVEAVRSDTDQQGIRDN